MSDCTRIRIDQEYWIKSNSTENADSNHISALGWHFDSKWWARNMILSPHHQQCVFASFAYVVINCEGVFTGVLHLHLFAWTFWIVQADEQNAVTFGAKQIH